MEPFYYLILVGISLPVWAVSYWAVPYFTTYKHLKQIPGPLICKFSNIWLALGARQGQKYAWVDQAHRKYGKIVRVRFNHVSIATPEGLHTVYAHGNGFLKDTFYEAFVSGVPGVFNVRHRGEHTRKRKIIAHAFSPGAVQDFETHMSANLERWVRQLDNIATHPDPEGYARMNMMPWCTFLAFDIIGDLAFGAPFGMVSRGRDECEASLPGKPITYVPGAETLNRRGEVSSTLGLLPEIRPFAKYLPDPFFTKGLSSVENLHGIAENSVAKRLEASEKGYFEGKKRNDILEMLCNAKDSSGNPMPRAELVSEALTQLIAGSDTVSNTACAVIYWILSGERSKPGSVVSRLQAELDAAIPADSQIAAHHQVKNLKFLRQCIDEGMRLHSTSAIGLPRIVTAQHGVSYGEHHFPEGTVLSVPSYSIHHDADVWGPDVEEFKPDRWLNLTPRQKVCFNPFSYGPRACVGQNVAHMELALIVGTAFHRYDFKLYQPRLESHEGFSKKPLKCWVGIKNRRHV
ncbi:cytochrome P450 [Aspergillus saccharolyticus JOP 1030-1]|uniref:Cytochrome p450 benzoate 4-monooxygenase n=1 Tax=Aspergillus saccharolyticus JOP 1030-1 TaxID=1450539 RepID=A0A318ZM40_9EURO|nr:cytochrome p450 benzoate 4-monooxygenase [Aspergillus saccharolyticus JOP 1030-1]PYH45513.1 cytochrome p450 benzoate 4-monooxygenase [Aspergillus saccharolyticus JOP 1030-1]